MESNKALWAKDIDHIEALSIKCVKEDYLKRKEGDALYFWVRNKAEAHLPDFKYFDDEDYRQLTLYPPLCLSEVTGTGLVLAKFSHFYYSVPDIEMATPYMVEDKRVNEICNEMTMLIPLSDYREEPWMRQINTWLTKSIVSTFFTLDWD